jgi:hypothetical protein
MANAPLYFVDGLLSVATHNGVHRLVLFKLSGGEKGTAEPCVEIAVPDSAVRSIMETMGKLSKGAQEKPPSEVVQFSNLVPTPKR